MSFQILPLDAEEFIELQTLSDKQLQARNIQKRIAHCHPGYPCRVSLEDAERGESVYLLNYEHHDVDSPYRSSHAIFVRAKAAQAHVGVDEVPESLTIRLLSLRAFDTNHDMVAADVVKGRDAAAAINKIFEDPQVQYIHIHNAKPGCFAARAIRA